MWSYEYDREMSTPVGFTNGVTGTESLLCLSLKQDDKNKVSQNRFPSRYFVIVKSNQSPYEYFIPLEVLGLLRI